MKTIIVYKSKTGFTERYAKWIQEELHCDLCRLENASTQKLAAYDTVIFGGRTHAGNIDSLKKLRTLLPASAKLVIFTTGASPAEEQTISAMWKNNLTEDELASVPHFYMPSGLDYDKMGMADKLLMRMFASMMKNKKDKTEQEAEMAQAISGSYDISSREYILPLVRCINGENTGE